MKLPAILPFVYATAASQQFFPRALPPSIATNDQNYVNCRDAAWPGSDAFKPLSPQSPDAELRQALSEVDPDRIEAIIKKLVSFGTRHTLSTQTNPNRGIGAARDWIASEMRTFAANSNGRMNVTVPSYIQGVASRILFPVRISNVLATLTGSTDPGRVYVITGHYDSRVTDVNDYTSDAPGADDDASGVAVAMELARVMSTRKSTSTIIFGAVAGEEQGLYGSNFLAESLKNASVNVQAMQNNDIVGSSTGDRGQKDPYTIRLFAQGPPPTETAAQAALRLQIGAENDSPARELGRFAVEVAANDATEMNISMIYRLDRYLRGGDHTSFLDQGYAAVRFTEPNENFAHQHQDVRVENGTQYGDLPQFVDYDFVARVARTNLASLWSLANGPAAPANVTVDTENLTNDSEFFWTESDDDMIASYEVVYRATDAPFWTHQLNVGNVNTVTVPLSKDNVLFGIRAVGSNGYKSPAVVPFPSSA